MAFPRWSVGTIKVVLLGGFLDLPESLPDAFRGHGPLLLHYRAGGEGWEGARPARNCGENKAARPADTRWAGPFYAYAAQMPKPGSRS